MHIYPREGFLGIRITMRTRDALLQSHDKRLCTTLIRTRKAVKPYGIQRVYVRSVVHDEESLVSCLLSSLVIAKKLINSRTLNDIDKYDKTFNNNYYLIALYKTNTHIHA